MSKVIIIGSGFAGLSAACSLAQKGFEVKVLEMHDKPGGRARQFTAEGFTFDMGPSWYWMPDVFEDFFQRFGKSRSDYYDLTRLDPSYKVFFTDDELDIPATETELFAMFDKIEPGSGKLLQEFLDDAEYKYQVGMQDLVYKPGLSIVEFIDKRVISASLKLHLFSNISNVIRSRFKDSRLRDLLEFPVLFLGARPENTPALYSLMNYADMKLGTWYPKGGMVKIVDAMYDLAKELGVTFHFNQEVVQVDIQSKSISSIVTKTDMFEADIVVASGDYHHFEQQILPEAFRSYSKNYWSSRKMAPSSLIYYIGINKELPNVEHHNLFFDADFDKHASSIYDTKTWPDKPLFYLSCTSKSDDTAPQGMENLFILIPSAAGLQDTPEVREHYLNVVAERIEKKIGVDIRNHVVYQRSFAYTDFVSEYHSFQGNAYGLANTLGQTAILKPKIKSNKLKNLFYAGQLTVPGPGVPPSIISGQVVADLIEKKMPKAQLV